MAESETVLVRWIAPFEASLPSGVQLIPGVTVVELPLAEGVLSDNWQTVEAVEPDAGDLREIAAANDIKVAGNAKVETVVEKLLEAGVPESDIVAYRDIEISLDDEAPADEPAAEDESDEDDTDTGGDD